MDSSEYDSSSNTLPEMVETDHNVIINLLSLESRESYERQQQYELLGSWLNKTTM